ncbi:MAG: hypothetical protein AAGI38_02305 [Bacteroidota bacterium]
MKQRFCLVLALLVFSFLDARPIFSGLNFGETGWAMVGVPIHNYKSLPIQQELGTFIVKDRNFMRQIQQSWDFPITFENKCDHHYAIKIYHNNQLVRTLKINLYCGYITFDGMAYEFNPDLFEAFRNNASSIDWSRISFVDQGLLNDAIVTLDNRTDVYWYEDVYPYTFPGYFMIGLNNLPWNTDMDSLKQVVHTAVSNQTRSNDFYLQTYFHIVKGDNMTVRYLVNCKEELSERFPYHQQFLKWRSHLADRDSIHIVAIGIDQEKYKRIMRPVYKGRGY